MGSSNNLPFDRSFLEQLLNETSRQRFENKAFLPPVPELAKEDWIARCAAPLGMDAAGSIYSPERMRP